MLTECAERLGVPHLFPEVFQDREITGRDDLSLEHRRSLRLFTEAFTARDIADPLRSFDDRQSSDAVARILREHGQDVAGVRRDGLSVGYLRQDDLDAGDCRQYRRDFRKDQVITGDAPLSDVIDVLTRRDFCFVTSMGDVAAVIDRGCVEKPLARMWLFGIVTLTEMDIGNRIRSTWPDGEWVGYLSAGRRKKAQDFLEERRRRGQHLDLLDCLQLSDKGQILMRDPEQREAFGLTSTEQAKKAIKELVSLRDNLAHASDIVTHDWPQIARMARRIEDLATGTA